LRILLVLLGLFCAGWAHAERLDGVVIVVIDGDTVLFKPDHYSPASRAFVKVRLAGIDAPEADQPHGDAATQALKALALKRRAVLEIVATDVYGRRVGYLEVDGGRVNRDMVRRGHAWASQRAARDMRAAEAEARGRRAGLWADVSPVPPWVWRRAVP
jgi:endonuclease YncB( thermonuclease family)